MILYLVIRMKLNNEFKMAVDQEISCHEHLVEAGTTLAANIDSLIQIHQKIPKFTNGHIIVGPHILFLEQLEITFNSLETELTDKLALGLSNE